MDKRHYHQPGSRPKSSSGKQELMREDGNECFYRMENIADRFRAKNESNYKGISQNHPAESFADAW
tara:strand:+ start:475 stop:672 length:198 start_codon:yes stop_codon:yes gene_type:complete